MIRYAFIAGLTGFGVLFTTVAIQAGSEVRHQPPPAEVAYRDPASLPAAADPRARATSPEPAPLQRAAAPVLKPPQLSSSESQ